MAHDETSPLLQDTENETPYHTNGAVDAEHAPESATSGEAEEMLKPEVSMAAIIVPMSIGLFLVAMDSTIVASSYASIGSELKQLQNTSWIATGYLLTMTSFQPLYGKLSDIFGRKPCLIFAYAIFALGCLFCGLAQDLTQLVAARALAGIGGGGMTTIASIIMSDIVPLRSRGTWQGVGNIIFATGSSTGAPLGGLLADTIGWRWSFLGQVPLTAIAILAISLGLNLPKHPESDFKAKLKRIDFAGAFTLVVAVFSLLLALDQGGNVSWRDRTTLIALAAFAVLTPLFALIETRFAREPFAPARIVANRTLLAAYLANFFAMGAGLAAIFHVSLYCQAVRGASAAQAGLALLPSILMSVIGSLGGGLIMQATGRYYFLTIGVFSSMLAGTVLVAGMTGAWTHSAIGLAFGIGLSGIGPGAGSTTTLIAVIANAGSVDQAIATAVSYLFRSLGSVVSLSVGTTLVQNTLRRELYARLSGEDVEEIITRVRESLSYIDELEPAVRAVVIQSYEDALQVAFWFVVALTACALVSSFFIKETKLTR